MPRSVIHPLYRMFRMVWLRNDKVNYPWMCVMVNDLFKILTSCDTRRYSFTCKTLLKISGLKATTNINFTPNKIRTHEREQKKHTMKSGRIKNATKLNKSMNGPFLWMCTLQIGVYVMQCLRCIRVFVIRAPAHSHNTHTRTQRDAHTFVFRIRIRNHTNTRASHQNYVKDQTLNIQQPTANIQHK